MVNHRVESDDPSSHARGVPAKNTLACQSFVLEICFASHLEDWQQKVDDAIRVPEPGGEVGQPEGVTNLRRFGSFVLLETERFD